MPWEMYEVVVEERRLKYYKVRAQSEGHARTMFSRRVTKLLNHPDVVVAPTLTVVVKNVRRLPKN